jgi:hypothetical protein
VTGERKILVDETEWYSGSDQYRRRIIEKVAREARRYSAVLVITVDGGKWGKRPVVRVDGRSWLNEREEREQQRKFREYERRRQERGSK